MNIRQLIESVSKNEALNEPLFACMVLNEIDTPLRACHFLAQLSHESNGFTRLTENLNYSEKGLLKTFGKYFKDGKEKSYARKPQMIANRVYADRMGNGSEDSGDGWKFRGRSPIQLTGKNNYILYSRKIFNDNRLVENPDLALDPSIGAQICCEYWMRNNLNVFADADDIDSISDLINIGRKTKKYGDSIGFDHRKQTLDKLKKLAGIS